MPQRSLLHVSQPVAASAAGIIVAFDYPFLFQQAADDTTLLENMERSLQRLTGNERQVVFVPKDKWPKFGKTLLKIMVLVRISKSRKPIKQKPQTTLEEAGKPLQATPAPMEEPPLPPEDEALTEETSPQEDNQVATAPQKLFGSDIVKVEDN